MDISVKVVDDDDNQTSKSDGLGPFFLPLDRAPWQSKCLWMDFGPNATILKKSDAAFRKENDPVWVFPQVSVNCVDQIDSVNQTFRARYTFFLNCSITSDDFDRYMKDPIGWRPSYFPTFMPYNAAFVDRMEPVVNPDGTIFSLSVQRGLWVGGCFYEHCVTYSSPFDLVYFPFDVQVLEIKFEIRDNHQSWCKTRPLLKLVTEPYYGGPGDNCAGFQNVWVPPQGEWNIEQSWIYGESFLPNAASWGPVFQVAIRAQRQWRYFAWHVVLIMFLLGIATLFIFILDDIGTILEFMVGLLLAAVAFLFTVNSKLPSLGYLTLIDKYLFGVIVFMLGSGLLLIIPTALDRYGRTESAAVDWLPYLFLADSSLLIVGHLVFGYLCIRAKRHEQGKLIQTPRQYSKDVPKPV